MKRQLVLRPSEYGMFMIVEYGKPDTIIADYLTHEDAVYFIHCSQIVEATREKMAKGWL